MANLECMLCPAPAAQIIFRANQAGDITANYPVCSSCSERYSDEEIYPRIQEELSRLSPEELEGIEELMLNRLGPLPPYNVSHLKAGARILWKVDPELGARQSRLI